MGSCDVDCFTLTGYLVGAGMKLADLITDAGTGMVSHTKVWANIAYFSATIAFIYMSYAGTASPDIWMVYLGVVGASATVSKLLSLKYTGVKSDAP